MSIRATFEDLRNPHFAENMEAYLRLKKLGIYTEEKLQELFERQMELDKKEEGAEDDL